MCEEWIFIQNTNNSLSLSGYVMETIGCRFFQIASHMDLCHISPTVSSRNCGVSQRRRIVEVLIQNSRDIFAVESVQILACDLGTEIVNGIVHSGGTMN